MVFYKTILYAMATRLKEQRHNFYSVRSFFLAEARFRISKEQQGEEQNHTNLLLFMHICGIQ